MILPELQREAHAIALSKGWWDEERTFGDLIALVHSELSEALEWYRELGTTKTAYTVDADGALTKPEGVPYELADVVIRVADMAERYGVDLEALTPSAEAQRGIPAFEFECATFGDWITNIHGCLSYAANAYQDWEAGIILPTKWQLHLVMAIQRTYRMAAHYDIDLDAAIEAKMAYNRTRPYRHGGKAL